MRALKITSFRTHAGRGAALTKCMRKIGNSVHAAQADVLDGRLNLLLEHRFRMMVPIQQAWMQVNGDMHAGPALVQALRARHHHTVSRRRRSTRGGPSCHTQTCSCSGHKCGRIITSSHFGLCHNSISINQRFDHPKLHPSRTIMHRCMHECARRTKPQWPFESGSLNTSILLRCNISPT